LRTARAGYGVRLPKKCGSASAWCRKPEDPPGNSTKSAGLGCFGSGQSLERLWDSHGADCVSYVRPQSWRFSHVPPARRFPAIFRPLMICASGARWPAFLVPVKGKRFSWLRVRSGKALRVPYGAAAKPFSAQNGPSWFVTRAHGTEQDQNGKVENISENIFGGRPQYSRTLLKVLVPRDGIEPPRQCPGWWCRRPRAEPLA
jgi:hypothetical protein